VWNTGWCHNEHIAVDSALFVADSEKTTALQYKIEFVGGGVRVNSLNLTGLKTIQSNHNVLALPKRGFIKLLRLGALEVVPIKKVRHGSKLPQDKERMKEEG
jgi:hypothetical protein